MATWYADNLLDHGYRECVAMVQAQAQDIVLRLRHFGPDALAESTDMVDQAVVAALAYPAGLSA